MDTEPSSVDIHELDPSNYIDSAYGYSADETASQSDSIAPTDVEPSYPSYLYTSTARTSGISAKTTQPKLSNSDIDAYIQELEPNVLGAVSKLLELAYQKSDSGSSSPEAMSSDSYEVQLPLTNLIEKLRTVLPLAAPSNTSIALPATQVASSSMSVVKDWNAEFQTLLDMPDDGSDKFLRLRNLAHDFISTAEMYGKIIISEFYLPVEEKTIKPFSAGGIAGGMKFLCQSILFKFAVDIQLPRSGTWMYGGKQQSTENAMKAAKHELRSVSSYYNCNVSELRVPLMALIDYRGFRLIASSLLPISKDTICYGSSDAGATVHCSPDVVPYFAVAAKKLNLRAHRYRGKKLHAPVDIEGHHGRDGRIYVIDTARLFPAEAPARSLRKHSRAIFFKLLRPELIRRFRLPLSSDAFSWFGKYKADMRNMEVELATGFLIDEVIPEFVKNVQEGTTRVKTCSQLVEEMHTAGINLRYLGLLRNRATDGGFRALLLQEMVTRCVKNEIRKKWRKVMRDVRISIEAPFVEVIIDMLNLILGKEGMESSVFWTSRMVDLLKFKFISGIDQDEYNGSKGPLTQTIDLVAVIDRLQGLLGFGVRWSTDFVSEEKRKFIYTDITSMNTILNHMNIVSFAEGMLLMKMAEDKKKHFKLSLYEMAEAKLVTSKAQATTASVPTLFQLGKVYYQKVKLKAENSIFWDILNGVLCFRKVLEFARGDEPVYAQAIIKILKLYFLFVRTNKKLKFRMQLRLKDVATLMDRAYRKAQSKLQRLLHTATTSNVEALGSVLEVVPLCSSDVKQIVMIAVATHHTLDFSAIPHVIDVNAPGGGFGQLVASVNDVRFDSVRELAFTNCLAVTDSLLSSLLPKLAVDGMRESLVSLSLSGCRLITDAIATLFEDNSKAPRDRRQSSPSLASNARFPKLSTLNLSLTQITDKFFRACADTAPSLLANLTSLDTTGCLRVSDLSVKILATRCQALRTLNLNGCPRVTNPSSLRSCHDLTRLNLGKTSVTDSRLHRLLSERMSKLTDLDINTVPKLTDAAFPSISGPIPLQRAVIYGTHMSSKILLKLSEHASALRHLDLGVTNYFNLENMGDNLGQLTQIDNVTIKYCQDPGSVGRLVALWKEKGVAPSFIDFGGCYDTFHDSIAVIMPKHNCTHLNLSVCESLSSATLSRIVECQHLRSLNLSLCSQLVDSTLATIIKACTGIEELILSRCQQLTSRAMTEIGKYLPNLTYLHVGHCRGIVYLANLGINCPRLRTLRIPGLPGLPSDQIRRLFSQGLEMRCINVHETKIDDRALTILAMNSPLLGDIYLSDCKVQDQSVSVLIDQCWYLQVLDLTGVAALTDAPFVQSAETSLKYVRVLKLSGCRKLTDSTLKVLAKRCPLLESINLSGIPGISARGVCNLAASCPRLNAVNVTFCDGYTSDADGIKLLADECAERAAKDSTILVITK